MERCSPFLFLVPLILSIKFLTKNIKNMKNKLIITGLVSVLCAFAPSIQAQLANIGYGSLAGPGAAVFLGIDGAKADSITLGCFDASTANIALTGWTEFVTDSNFDDHIPTVGINTGTLSDFDVSSALNKEVWVLITDAGVQALVRLNSWASITGAVAPASPTNLDYTFGPGATVASITTLGGVTVQDDDGFQGSGVSFTLVVPEPATYAAVLGLVTLVGVVFYRRR